ncbi:putative inactive receptor kinase [Acorus gramineus]|uniref:Inactive receptor kinase n=1 Tax=Acorus gramineus TaxID=55184 RepID=A0AAV9A820_ACOGR|nr:putative inactive receptor kinase [Acorus gramineus]
MEVSLPVTSLILLLLYTPLVFSEPTSDKAALLAFLSNTPHESRLRWNSSASACTWVGVTCSSDASSVVALRLPGVGLLGPLPPSTLGRLSNLRVLSLRSNRLSGPLPSDLSNLSHLRSLYLQGNLLSGGFPATLTNLTRLTRLDISNNNFSGEIPFAVNNLRRLTGLFLERNNFSGPLPSISVESLSGFNVSSNRLNGSVPQSLQRFPKSSFDGNLDLCGGPLPPCKSFFPSPAAPPTPETNPIPKTSNNHRLSTAAIIAISVASVSVLLLLVLLLLVFCVFRRKRQRPTKPTGKGPPSGAVTAVETGTTSSSKDDIGALAESERNKLVFFEGGLYSFDLEDLLRASAEVLGKGIVGTSYKAVLEEGTTVVVKRLKDVAVTKREFEVQMEVLGRVKHENVVPLRAFYYSKDEKLLVYDYFPAGSLSALLHGSRGSGRGPLDWYNRLRIAIAAGRGLSHLHSPTGAGGIPHGDIKASNVLLSPTTPSVVAALSDFGLHPLFTPAAAPRAAGGYRAPELVETRKPTLKTDVYGFGVLLLELLTGKSPNQASLGEEGIDLPRWVQSVVREEWTAEVFDVELMMGGGGESNNAEEEEMVGLLQVAMACVSTSPDQRPEMGEVVRMMEEIANRTVESDEKGGGGGSGEGGPTP